MAKQNAPKPAAASRGEYGLQTPSAGVEEPVNSEQLEAQEAARDGQEALARAPGPDTGELEERAAEAEERAEAAERRNELLAKEVEEMKAQMALLLRQARSPQQRPDEVTDAVADWDRTGEPVFDETAPHGTVYGDGEVAYLQDGHQFGRDRRYLRTEKNRGVPRVFNPRLVGLTRPRPNQQQSDILDWVRGRD